MYFGFVSGFNPITFGNDTDGPRDCIRLPYEAEDLLVVDSVDGTNDSPDNVSSLINV